MADEVDDGIENALNLVVLKKERSGNIKKDLKQTIFETVSTLRNLFVKLKTGHLKTIYLAEKARYEATIKREKILSWKEYCNLTSSSNPWNEVYKLAAGKRRDNTQIKLCESPTGP